MCSSLCFDMPTCSAGAIGNRAPLSAKAAGATRDSTPTKAAPNIHRLITSPPKCRHSLRSTPPASAPEHRTRLLAAETFPSDSRGGNRGCTGGRRGQHGTAARRRATAQRSDLKRIVPQRCGSWPCALPGPEDFMTQHVGKLAEVWRFPVKSMGGERLDAAELTP